MASRPVPDFGVLAENRRTQNAKGDTGMTAENAAAEPRLAEATERQRSPEHELLDSLVGKWITVGETIQAEGAPALAISASDVYEWVAGRFFVLHTAYGRIGDSNVGGIEIIGYDADAKKFKTYFFDSQGNISTQDLTYDDGTWTWSGPHTRATGVLSDDGNTMPTLHEWSDDGVNWRPSMDVTLRKVV
jgi:hypothetical protein